MFRDAIGFVLTAAPPLSDRPPLQSRSYRAVLTEPRPEGADRASGRYARADENFVLASYGRERADTINPHDVTHSDFTDPQGPLLTS